jgi:hypothetical protein
VLVWGLAGHSLGTRWALAGHSGGVSRGSTRGNSGGRNALHGLGCRRGRCCGRCCGWWRAGLVGAGMGGCLASRWGLGGAGGHRRGGAGPTTSTTAHALGALLWALLWALLSLCYAVYFFSSSAVDVHGGSSRAAAAAAGTLPRAPCISTTGRQTCARRQCQGALKAEGEKKATYL